MQEAVYNRARTWLRSVPLATRWGSANIMQQPSSLLADHVQRQHPLTRLHHAHCRSVLVVCVALYLFDILTGLGEMSAVCLNAHLLLDKYQIYRSSPHPSSRPSTPHLQCAMAPLGMLHAEQDFPVMGWDANILLAARHSTLGLSSLIQAEAAFKLKSFALSQDAHIALFPCGHPAPGIQYDGLCAHRPLPGAPHGDPPVHLPHVPAHHAGKCPIPGHFPGLGLCVSDVFPCITYVVPSLGICAHMQQSFRLKTCSPFLMPFALQNFACTLSYYATFGVWKKSPACRPCRRSIDSNVMCSGGCRMVNRGAYSGSCAVGLSGLVFGLIAIDNAVTGAQQRSIFGFFTVPAKVRPLNTPAASGG